MRKIQFPLVIILGFFFIPSIVMASWRNPFSWSWFNKSAKTETIQLTPPTATTTKNKNGTKTINDLTVSKNDVPKSTKTQTIKKTEGNGEQYDKPIPIASVIFDTAVIKSVLRLKIYDTVLKQDILWGSGISIGGLGNILTNYHVVEKAITDPVRYQVYGCVATSLNAQCDYFNYLLSTGVNGSKYNKNLDLALVYINQVYFDNKWSSVLDISLNVLGDHTVNLSSYTKNIKDIYVDYPVYSIGYPDYGGGSTVQSEGVVKELFTDQESGQKLILNSIDISHGNSGGPVFNSKGELVGVTVACLVASPDTEKCKTNSGLFIPLPTVNWWYTKITSSEIATWEGRQSYLPQNGVLWQGVLCSLRQNAHYDANVSASSCVCKAGYSKNPSGDCVDATGYVDPNLRYGKAPDPEAEQRALKSLMDVLGDSSTPFPSSEKQTNDQTCVNNYGPNRVWDGNKNRVSCVCKEGTLYFPNEFVSNPKWSGIVHNTYQPDDVAGWSGGACVDPQTITRPYSCGNGCQYK